MTLRVSSSRCRVPAIHRNPPRSIKNETHKRAVPRLEASARRPISVGEIASPRAWMIRMLIAKAVARISDRLTLARMVFAGPVLKNRRRP